MVGGNRRGDWFAMSEAFMLGVGEVARGEYTLEGGTKLEVAGVAERGDAGAGV